MPNPWPARWPTGSRTQVIQYPLDAAADFESNALVILDAGGEVTEAGADPTAVLGVASCASADVIEKGFIPVYIADGDTIFAMEGDRAPTAADVNTQFEVVKGADGIWRIRGTGTAAAEVVEVVDVDLDRELFFVKVLSGVRQLGA